MSNRKLIIVGACTIGLVVVGLFYACKKDSSVIKQTEAEVKEQPLIGQMEGTDTIYIPANLPRFCYECNSCDEPDGCCLPEFVKRGSKWDIKSVQDVFDAIIDADDNTDADKLKINIIKKNRFLFNKFIKEEWLLRLENGAGSLSCIQHLENKYFFSLSLKSVNGRPTPFIIGQNVTDAVIFDNLIVPVILIEEDETLPTD